jgi:DNA repair protein RadC
MERSKDLRIIKNWPEDERPRERLVRYGAESLSDAQLLALILGTGDRTSRKNAFDLARDLLSRFGGLQELASAGTKELMDQKGMGMAKTAQVKAALEMGKRLVSAEKMRKTRFIVSKDVADYYLSSMQGLKKEVFKTVLLDGKNRMIRELSISEGSLTESIVHPREVFSQAIRELAAGIILVHNHPSGDPSPSQKDRDMTKRLTEAGGIIGIPVLDHIIIGQKRYFSFLDHHLMKV